MPKEKLVSVLIRVPEKDLKKIKQILLDSGMTMNGYLNKKIREEIKNEGKVD